MTSHPFTVSPDAAMPEAHEIMAKSGVKRLPVTRDGKLVGVISKSDIDRYSPTKATALSMGEITYLLAKTKVSQVMVKDPLYISPDALLEEAALLMRDNGIGFLPVMEGGKLAGVITESDIFDAFIELMGFRDPGTRFTIEAEDIPGSMSRLTGIFAEYGINIMHVAVYRGTGSKDLIVLGVNSLNTGELEKRLEGEGFKIIYKLRNSKE
jgi:acetoin utilization protein AcuB